MEAASLPDDAQLENTVLNKYYTDNDLLLSLDGILKVLAIVSAAGGAAAGGAGGAAALHWLAALCCTALCAARLADLALLAPRLYLLCDIVLSSVLGVLLFIVGVVGIVTRQQSRFIDYVTGPLSLVSGLALVGSAAAAFSSSDRRLRAARPDREPPRPHAREHYV